MHTMPKSATQQNGSPKRMEFLVFHIDIFSPCPEGRHLSREQILSTAEHWGRQAIFSSVDAPRDAFAHTEDDTTQHVHRYHIMVVLEEHRHDEILRHISDYRKQHFPTHIVQLTVAPAWFLT